MNDIRINAYDGSSVEAVFIGVNDGFVSAFIEARGVSIHPEDESDTKIGETMTVEAMSMALWKIIYGKNRTS